MELGFKLSLKQKTSWGGGQLDLGERTARLSSKNSTSKKHKGKLL